jgi:nicotinamide-nucleotide amidase
VTVPRDKVAPIVAGYAVDVTHDEQADQIAGEISGLARSTGRTIAVAESLTGGRICAALAAAESSSEWFRGGLVAYSSEVKHTVLHVPGGPVVSAEAAEAMGVGVRDLLGADVGVAVTGAGGPAPQDDQQPGTVFLAVVDGSESGSEPQRRHIDGDPGQVCATAVTEALQLLAERLRLPAITSSGAIGSG